MGGFFQIFTEFFGTSYKYEHILTTAIIDGDLETVKQAAPYVDLNHHFKETGELPVFFALRHHQPEIASYLVEEHNASVDIKYPDNSLHKGKCSFEVALIFVSEGLMPASYLPMLKNFSAPGEECYFNYVQGQYYELSLPNCFASGKPTECTILPGECLNVKLVSTKDCAPYTVIYTRKEEGQYTFISNTTHDVFDSSFNNGEVVIETHYSHNSQSDPASTEDTVVSHNLLGDSTEDSLA